MTQEWQPIETAPKDGTLVLLYAQGTLASGVYEAGDWYFWEGEIVDCEGRLNHWIKGFGPTHWMPLPPPPKVTK